LNYGKNQVVPDLSSLCKADPELIKQVFKQQQVSLEDRIFSLEIFVKRGYYRNDLEHLISSFTKEIYRSNTGNRYYFNSRLNIERLKMLCDCKCVFKIKGGHYGRGGTRKDFNRVTIDFL
jgi:hypothetical protein